MSLDTVTLQCFLAVYETGSFTRAGERIGRTQSAVSQQIARLEHLLGVSLLKRGRTVTLSAEGEIFLGYARQIFSLQRQAMDRFRQPDLEGEVRFGLPEDFASVYLTDVLLEFVHIHPRILLNIETDLTLNLFERFKNREFDLVLVKMSQPEDFPNGQEVWSEPLEWVGDPEVLAGDQPVPLVLSPQPCVYRARAQKALDEAGLKWRLAFSSTSYAGTVAAVKAGLGLTVLPRNMVPRDLHVLPTGQLPAMRDTHVSLLKHSDDHAAVTSLQEFVLKRLQ